MARVWCVFVSLCVCVCVCLLCCITTIVAAQSLLPVPPPFTDVVSHHPSYHPPYKHFLARITDRFDNCTGCGSPKIRMVGSWAICDAPLLPSAAVAVLLALFAIRAFRGVGARTVGLRNYSRTFAMYALMMCCSITTHCFFLVECGGKMQSLYTTFSYITAILTSCIAVSFVFCGLVDLRILKDSGCLIGCLRCLSFCLVAVGYLIGVNFLIMYMGIVFVSFGLYIVMQFVKMCCLPRTGGICYLLAAGLVGAGAMSCIGIPSLGCHLCQHYGAWILEGAWYYGADLSMFFLAKYFVASRDVRLEVEYAPVRYT